MTLSEDKARTLAEIEVDCRRDDPDFADRMDLAAARRKRDIRLTIAQFGFFVGWVVLLVGAGTAHSLFSLGTIIACYGFVIVTLAAGIWLRLRRQRRW